MRVSTFQQFAGYSSAIADAQARYLQSQQEVMTGKKADLMTNDPVAGGYVLRATRLKSQLTQYASNLTTAKDFATSSEASLGNMGNILQQVQSATLQGASSTLDQTSRDALYHQVLSLRDQFVAEANTQGSAGQYIYGGQDNGKKPFTVVTGTPDTLQFNGDNNSINTEVGPNETLAVNETPSAQITATFDTLTKIASDLQGGQISNLSDLDVKSLQDATASLNQIRGQVGGKLQAIQDMTTRNTARTDTLSANISNAQDVDMSAAISSLQLNQTAYQAALQVTTMGSKLSLLNYLQ